MKTSRFAAGGSIVAFLFLALVPVSLSQEKRVEINPFFGYTFSDGVTVDPFRVGAQVYDSIHPNSGVNFGVHFGVFANENMEIGFLWARQSSTLQGKTRATTTDFTDMSNENYHAVFTYNWGDEDAGARPFLFGGLGATSFRPSDIDGRSINSLTKFSSTWGGGVKVYPSPSVGFTGMARWTPTYIRSDPGGIWCSPYWPFACYVVGNAEYANQFELSGGVSFRF